MKKEASLRKEIEPNYRVRANEQHFRAYSGTTTSIIIRNCFYKPVVYSNEFYEPDFA